MALAANDVAVYSTAKLCPNSRERNKITIRKLNFMSISPISIVKLQDDAADTQTIPASLLHTRSYLPN